LGFLTVAHGILYVEINGSKRVIRWKVKQKTPINYSKI